MFKAWLRKYKKSTKEKLWCPFKILYYYKDELSEDEESPFKIF